VLFERYSSNGHPLLMFSLEFVASGRNIPSEEVPILILWGLASIHSRGNDDVHSFHFHVMFVVSYDLRLESFKRKYF
jgi:hypothetical protein